MTVGDKSGDGIDRVASLAGEIFVLVVGVIQVIG